MTELGGRPRVTIVTEGTYPITLGGVTTWVQRLIEYSENVRFNVLCLAPPGKKEPVVEIPDNVEEVVIEEVIPRRSDPRRWLDRALPTHRIKWSIGRRLGRYKGLERALRHLLEGRTLDEGMLRELYEGSRRPSRVLQGPLVHSLVEFVEELAGPVDRLSDAYWAVVNVCSFALGIASHARRLPECDVAHPQNSGVCGFLCAVRKAAHGTPFIVTEHGILTKELDARLEGMSELERELYRGCFESMIRTSYRHCDEILEISDYHREHAVRHGAPEEKVDVIYSGIETWKFPPPEDMEGKFLRADRLHVGTVARVEPIKGIDVFVRMAARVVKRLGRDRVRFHVVGPVDDEEHYRECVRLVRRHGLRGIFKFHGPQPPDEVLRFYHRFHVFVLSSRSEGLPMSLLEAMSSGCPVVASEVGAVPYIVDEEIGRTFPVEDHRAGAEALVSVLKDPSRLLEMARRAVERAKRFDVVRMCREYERRYATYARS